MTRTIHSLTINKPVEEVFAYINDEEHMTKWLSGLVSITPLDDGGARVGAKSRQVYNENGREFEMIEEMLIYKPNQHVKIKAESDMFDILAEYRLTPVNNGTRIDFESKLSFHNMLFKVMGLFMGGSSKKKVVEDFARLKALVEAE